MPNLPILKLCFGLALLTTLIQLCTIPMGGRDTDFWWHLAAGRYMWEHGQILTHDVFSHTRLGEVWDNRDWAFQVLLYGVYQLGGLNAGFALRIGFILGGLAVLGGVARLRGAGYAGTAIAILWAGSLAANYPNVRPYVVSLFCAASALYALECLRQQADPSPRLHRRLALMLWLSLWIWSNMHGGVSLVGLAMVVVYAAVSCLAQPGNWRAWSGITLACAVAIVLVPQPLLTVAFVFDVTVGKNPYHGLMVESFPPNFLAPHERPYLAFIVLFVSGAVVRACRRQPLDLLLFLSFAPLLFTGGRHQFLLIPLLSPGLASMLTDLGGGLAPALPRLGPRSRSWGVALLCLLALLVSLRQTISAVRRGWPPQRLISWEGLPEGACRWIVAQGLGERMFNDMPWGGYLLWRLGPDAKVFMDARNEAYGHGQVLEDFLAILLKGGLSLLDQYRVDFVVLPTNPSPTPSTLGKQLLASGKWLAAYDDGVAVVYLRASGVSPRRASPAPYWTELRQRAGEHVRQGQPWLAIDDLNQALELNPDGASMRVQLGVLLGLEHLAEAERQWRLALLTEPVALAHYNLGLAAEKKGDLWLAACEFQLEVELNQDENSRRHLEKLPRISRLLYSAHTYWSRFWAPCLVW